MGNPNYRNFGLKDAKFQIASATRSNSFTDAGDLVTHNSHGLSNGAVVVFQSITTTTGVTANVRYYVIGATTNTFQIATTVGGSAVTLTTDGTGTYRAILEHDVYLANAADLTPKSKDFTHAGDDTEISRQQILGYDIKLAADCMPLATHMALFSKTAYTASLPITAVASTANTSLVYGGDAVERQGVTCGLWYVITATRVDETTGAETNVYVTRWWPVGTVSGVTPGGVKTGDKQDVTSYMFSASKTSVDVAGGALPATVPTGGVFYADLEVAVP